MTSHRLADGARVAGWLCPQPVDRLRILALDERLGHLVRLLLPISLVASAFWLGPWALLPPAFPCPRSSPCR